ncbi:MAG: PTS sugar transporter subunit IIA [Candidatus Tenebribacter burtonii]|jgi:PTS system nitrogen regulatory IIA component|nr:PTS sugar transporter subunit IIA [Candidatus Tenebribacter burtonii]
MEFSKIVKLECCEVNFTAKNKTEVLQNIGKLLKRSREFRNVEEDVIFKALEKREEMGSTGFSNGIAIPHCQLEGIDNFIIALAICKKGIHFDSLDNKKSKIFITIVGPKGDMNTHLKLLAQVSLILKEPNVINEILQSTTKIGLYEEFLRNTNNIKTITKKGKEVLMMLTVKDESIMQDITEVFVEYGIQDSIILETQNMENLLSTTPLFMGFFNFTSEQNALTKIILVKLTKDHINALIKGLEDVFGDLDTYSALSILVLDIFFSKGIM